MTATDPTTAQPATPGQAQVRLVMLALCQLCLSGAGGECHVPGCALYMNRAPDLPLDAAPAAPPDDLANLRATIDRVLESMICNRPGRGAPGVEHCAACCMGTGWEVTSQAELDLAEALDAARMALGLLSSAPPAGTEAQ